MKFIFWKTLLVFCAILLRFIPIYDIPMRLVVYRYLHSQIQLQFRMKYKQKQSCNIIRAECERNLNSVSYFSDFTLVTTKNA